jgi:MYXO-CTERM domain-containing protein
MKAIALTALAAAAGLATASPYLASGLTDYSVNNAGAPTQTITVDVSGINFNDAPGSALNEMLSVALGLGAEVTGIGWDVNLTTVGGSWASEAVIDFEGQINLTVGIGDDFGVTNQNYASGGILDLSDNGLPNITLGGDGNLDMEFFEGFVDNGGAGDAFFEQGSVLFLAVTGVPTPGSLAVLGLGGIVAGRRRR